MSTIETSAPSTARQCPRCGAPLTDEQEWCLRCGAAVGTRIVAAPGWRTPIVAVAVILALAAAAIVVAIVQLADDAQKLPQQPTASVSPAPAASPPPPAATTPPPAEPQATPTATAEALPSVTGEDSTGATAGDVGEWPAGKTGYTIVLASVKSRSTAAAKAKALSGDGVADVGILHSDDYSSLSPGYWVVYSGSFESRAQATGALDGIKAEQAYVRQIKP